MILFGTLYFLRCGVTTRRLQGLTAFKHNHWATTINNVQGCILKTLFAGMVAVM
jgi:hypothetical protein